MTLFKTVSIIDDRRYLSLIKNIQEYRADAALDGDVCLAVTNLLKSIQRRKELMSSQAELDNLNKVVQLINQALRQQMQLEFLPVALESYGFLPERRYDYFEFMLQYSENLSFFVDMMMTISLWLYPNQEINDALAIFVEKMNNYLKCSRGSDEHIASYQNSDGTEVEFYI